MFLLKAKSLFIFAKNLPSNSASFFGFSSKVVNSTSSPGAKPANQPASSAKGFFIFIEKVSKFELLVAPCIIPPFSIP